MAWAKAGTRSQGKASVARQCDAGTQGDAETIPFCSDESPLQRCGVFGAGLYLSALMGKRLHKVHTFAHHENEFYSSLSHRIALLLPCLEKPCAAKVCGEARRLARVFWFAIHVLILLCLLILSLSRVHDHDLVDSSRLR